MCRLVIFATPEGYETWVSDTLKRILTADELPVEIKDQLAAIALSPDRRNSPYYNADFTWTAYVHPNLSDYECEFGWRLDESAYCVIISPEVVKRLGGKEWKE
jgi:hypothetical protein